MVSRPGSHAAHSGVSLIEMMVTIAIMMLLALAVAPFSASWGAQAYMRQSQTLLMQGMSQLKAIALRNPSASSAGASAVMISIPGKLCVASGVPAALNCNSAAWTSDPPASIQVNGANSQCVALDSAGMPVAANVNGTVCGTTLSFRVSRGSETPLNGTLN